jgi:hypothetical protein
MKALEYILILFGVFMLGVSAGGTITRSMFKNNRG